MNIAHAAALLLVCAGLLNGPRLAADPATVSRAQEPVQLLEEWPELGRSERAAVAKDVERLRKAHTPEMAEEARTALVAIGGGCGPALFKALGKEKHDDARERVAAALTGVLRPEHGRLVAAEFDDRSPTVRIFALEACAGFRDARLAEPAGAALLRARAAQESAGSEDRDTGELAAAALCATACGSTDGLDVLFDVARGQWKRRGAELRSALECVRGPDATKIVIARMAGGERDDTVAGLRLLAGCGAESAAAFVRPNLDATDNRVRVAAINALRGAVDGDPPLDKLPVFEAIERAGRWKERL